MKIGCCIDISHYDELVKCGYETITLAVKDVAAWSEEEMEAAAAKLAAGPLQTISLNSFCTADLKLAGPDYDPDKVRAYMDLVSARAQRLGYRYIGIGAPASRNVAPGEDPAEHMAQFKEAITILCDAAAPYGIDVLLESVCGIECNFLTTTR